MSSINIIPDGPLVVTQALPFLVLVAGLHFILYKPMLAYLDARSHATIGARKEAEVLQARAAARLAEWDAALARAQAEVTEYRSQRRAAANVGYQRVIAEARGAADAHIQGAVAALRVEADTARAELQASSLALSREVAVRVLGRPLASIEA